MNAPNELLSYPDPRGLAGLRESLTEYLARARGVRTTADHIVICSGFVQALNLLSVTLRRLGGATLAVESYGLQHHRAIVRAAGLGFTPLTVDYSGARVAELTDAAGVLLTPAHQFPSGAVLSAARRAEVLEWSRSGGGLVIEDDYDGEFRYDRKPIGALQGIAPDAVAYVGTASKSLAPGLGLAWLVVPSRLIDAVVETKLRSDGYTGVFEQLTLHEFLRCGAYDRHVRRSRLRYRRRRDQLLAVLNRPGIHISGIAAGLHAVVELDGRTARDEVDIKTRAARAGVRLTMLSEFRYDEDPAARAGVVVGYGTPPDHGYTGALAALSGLLS